MQHSVHKAHFKQQLIKMSFGLCYNHRILIVYKNDTVTCLKTTMYETNFCHRITL